MRKTLMIIMLIFTIFGSICVSLKLKQSNNKAEDNFNNNDKYETEDSKQRDELDEVDSIELEDEIVIEDKTSETIEKKDNSNTSKNESKNNNKSNNLPKKEQESTNKEVKKNKSSKKDSSNTVIKKEETAWDKLGISEYDYYNSPEIKWKTIDFSIKEYGSFDKTKEACYNAGTIYTEIESYRFRCYESYSYSGDFLGYHIEYIELES
ncbi:MAG: hypothetical protein E7162_01725 [Firmicutes bacterium]|nr:hypothetical protein [Bacillota bacterium]